MAALDLNLQFFFESGALARVFVTLPNRPIMTVTGEAATIAGDDWYGHDRVRLLVNSCEPPKGLAYSLVVENKPHPVDSPTWDCVLGLPKVGGAAFVVEAVVGAKRHKVTLTLTPSAGAPGPILWAIPIIVGPTPKPPTNPPNLLPDEFRMPLPPKMAELLLLLRDPELLRELDRRTDSPIVEALRSARSNLEERR